MNKLEEILQDFFEHSYMAGVRNERDDDSPQKFTKEDAQQKILQLVLEIIGDEERLSDTRGKSNQNTFNKIRNQLRTEQHKRAKDLLGDE